MPCFGLALAGSLALALDAAAEAPTAATLPAATLAFLGRFVDTKGNVNYAAIKYNSARLQGLLKRV